MSEMPDNLNDAFDSAKDRLLTNERQELLGVQTSIEQNPEQRKFTPEQQKQIWELNNFILDIPQLEHALPEGFLIKGIDVSSAIIIGKLTALGNQFYAEFYPEGHETTAEKTHETATLTASIYAAILDLPSGEVITRLKEEAVGTTETQGGFDAEQFVGNTNELFTNFANDDYSILTKRELQVRQQALKAIGGHYAEAAVGPLSPEQRQAFRGQYAIAERRLVAEQLVRIKQREQANGAEQTDIANGIDMPQSVQIEIQKMTEGFENLHRERFRFGTEYTYGVQDALLNIMEQELEGMVDFIQKFEPTYRMQAGVNDIALRMKIETHMETLPGGQLYSAYQEREMNVETLALPTNFKETWKAKMEQGIRSIVDESILDIYSMDRPEVQQRLRLVISLFNQLDDSVLRLNGCTSETIESKLLSQLARRKEALEKQLKPAKRT